VYHSYCLLPYTSLPACSSPVLLFLSFTNLYTSLPILLVIKIHLFLSVAHLYTEYLFLSVAHLYTSLPVCYLPVQCTPLPVSYTYDTVHKDSANLPYLGSSYEHYEYTQYTSDLFNYSIWECTLLKNCCSILFDFRWLRIYAQNIYCV
jgi:hypothetical protein